MNIRIARLLFLFTILASWCVAGQKKQDANLFPVVVDGKVGYINRTGKVVIEPQFGFPKYCGGGPSYFSEGLATVGIDDKNGFINRRGRVVIEPKFDFVLGFSQGLARADMFVRSPIDYRAFFKKIDGKWRMTTFIAGD